MTAFNPLLQLVWVLPVAIVLGTIRQAVRAKRRGAGPRWADLGTLQQVGVVAGLAATAVLALLAGQIRTSQHEGILRQQFHIPQEVALEHFSNQNKMTYRPRLEAVVRFDDAAYAAYAASLGNAALWSPVPFRYAGGGDITPAARGSGFMWYALPYPGWAGDITMRWGSNAMDAAQYVRNGRYYCTAIIAEHSATPDQPKRFTAKACRDVPRGRIAVAAILLAVLDADSKSLYATIY